MGQTWMAEPDADRIAFGPRAGHKVLTLHGVMPRESPQSLPALCADIDAFSLHAAVRAAAHDRKRLAALAMPQRPAQPEEANEAAAIAECEVEPAQGRPGRIRAARLLQRVLDIDLQHCPSVPPCP